MPLSNRFSRSQLLPRAGAAASFILGTATALVSTTASAACPAAASASAPPYKTAAVIQSACATNVDTFILNYFNAHPSATFQDLENAIKADSTVGGQACASCAFGLENDLVWSPIVYRADGSGNAFWNYGSCYERAPGGSFACGQKVEQLQLCIDQTCGACSTQQTKDTCTSQVASDQAYCGSYNTGAQTSCGANLAQLQTSCSSGAVVVKVMCGAAPTPDAGTSSSSSSTSSSSSSTGGISSSSSGGTEEGTSTSSSTSSSGGKKNPPPATTEDDTPAEPTKSGCAQAPGSNEGLALFAVAAVVVTAATRRRRSKR